MQISNIEYKKAIENAENSLLKSQVYCDVIEELFIFLGCEPFSKDYLNEILRDDIQRFITKQHSRLKDFSKKEDIKK